MFPHTCRMTEEYVAQIGLNEVLLIYQLQEYLPFSAAILISSFPDGEVVLLIGLSSEPL